MRFLTRRLAPLAALAALAVLGRRVRQHAGRQHRRRRPARAQPAPARHGDSRSASPPRTARCASGPAGRDRVAVPDHHRDALRDRRGPSGQGGGLAVGLPAQAPRTKLSAYQPNVEAIVGYKPDLVLESGDTGSLTRRLAAFSVPCWSCLPAERRRGLHRVRGAGPGDRAPRPGGAGGSPAAGPDPPDRRVGAAHAAGHLLLRARPDLLLDYVRDVRREPAWPPAEEHRGRRGRGVRVAATRSCPRSTSSRPPRPHDPGRHPLPPPERGGRRRRPGWAGPTAAPAKVT